MRYNRDLVNATIRAIKKVDQIRADRARAFYKNRMKAKKKNDREAEIREIQQNLTLIVSPVDQERTAQIQALAQSDRVSMDAS